MSRCKRPRLPTNQEWWTCLASLVHGRCPLSKKKRVLQRSCPSCWNFFKATWSSSSLNFYTSISPLWRNPKRLFLSLRFFEDATVPLIFCATNFAQILMEQHLFLFFFAVVKTASFLLCRFWTGSKNNMTDQKPFLRQLPILSGKLQNSIKKFFCKQNL